MALVMPVSTVICAGMARPGLTSVDSSSSTCPPRTRTAPISVMVWEPGPAPVVSRSTTTKVVSCRGVPMDSKEAWVAPANAEDGISEATTL